MRIAKKYDVPDDCAGCPWDGDPQAISQGGICFRCPVMICSGDDPVVPPSEFREDWAQSFVDWFAGDRADYPELPLLPVKGQRIA